jgi:hypothetical protein
MALAAQDHRRFSRPSVLHVMYEGGAPKVSHRTRKVLRREYPAALKFDRAEYVLSLNYIRSVGYSSPEWQVLAKRKIVDRS